MTQIKQAPHWFKVDCLSYSVSLNASVRCSLQEPQHNDRTKFHKIQFYTRTNKPYERLAEHLEMTNTVKYQTNKMYKTWYEIGPNVTNKKYYLVELK